MYELERRAIFSKKWILVTHQIRLVDPGDYIQITEAGFPLFVIKDRLGSINAFHNICRHRAYPIVDGQSGHVSILACKYHGWSYGFNGKLAKAPRYQDLEGFNPKANGLFPIHVHIDNLGFVWVNLDSKPQPTVPWDDDFGTVDLQPRLSSFDPTKYRFDHQWQILGSYNWKTLADNYNECYHCATGHPLVAAVTDLSKYWVETQGGHIQHFSTDKPSQVGLGVSSTYMYPNSSMTVTPHFFFIQRVVPLSAKQTKMEYEVYRHIEASDEDFNSINDFFKQVMSEDKDLCNAAQNNLNGDVFVNGELHPEAEKGPLYFQKLTRDLVMSHHKQETAMGKEWWPAMPQSILTVRNQEEVDFCKKLDCAAGAGYHSALEW
ncbi:putative Rieske 2Fe-2S family protein [Xylariales sp. PMI_506]|nr:putative Rieske 2Fe-2S family protein [Xylariales sp. PMI_506]